MNLTRWRTASLLAGALIAGTIVGPPLAQAATAGFARIEGGGTSNVVKVASTGQLQVAQADPKSLVAKYGTPDCKKGGIYKVPAGKALIITAVDFINGSSSPNSVHSLALLFGPSKDPCISTGAHVLAIQATGELAVTDNQTFPTGIPVPAGNAVGLFTLNGSGAVEIYGYLVPASAVPHNIGNSASATHLNLKGIG